MAVDKRPEIIRRGLDWCKHPTDAKNSHLADRFCLLVARFEKEQPADVDAWARDLLHPVNDWPTYLRQRGGDVVIEHPGAAARLPTFDEWKTSVDLARPRPVCRITDVDKLS